MTQPTTRWRIKQDATDAEAYVILAQDPIWNSFALADLEPPLRQYSQFAAAYEDESKRHAICLILRHPIIGQVLSPFGAEEGVATILEHVALPEYPLIQAQEIHISSLQNYYRPETSWKKILRMAITAASLQPQLHMPRERLKQLTTSDLPSLKKFYARHPENTFAADLFTQGIYFGAYEGERIIAAGGTHALVPTYQIAVLGNILTAPEARRQGYATAITRALVTTLLEQNYTTIVLNVFEDNSNAIRVYQRLGFQTHHRFLTGRAIASQDARAGL